MVGSFSGYFSRMDWNLLFNWSLLSSLLVRSSRWNSLQPYTLFWRMLWWSCVHELPILSGLFVFFFAEHHYSSLYMQWHYFLQRLSRSLIFLSRFCPISLIPNRTSLYFCISSAIWMALPVYHVHTSHFFMLIFILTGREGVSLVVFEDYRLSPLDFMILRCRETHQLSEWRSIVFFLISNFMVEFLFMSCRW